jgi:hypothetical protein
MSHETNPLPLTNPSEKQKNNYEKKEAVQVATLLGEHLILCYLPLKARFFFFSGF